MILSDKDVAYLIKRIQDMQKALDDKCEGYFRVICRQESCIQLLNLGGYGWDWDKRNAYKRTQREKREYFSPTSSSN